MKRKIVLVVLFILLMLALLFIANIMINKKQGYTTSDFVKEKDYTKSDFVLDNENKYQITTSMKFMTMRNDGGSHTNLYYQIDLNENKVIKCEDEYAGFKGYKYEGKVLDVKKLNAKEKQDLKLLLDNISNNIREEPEEFIYDFYILSSVNKNDVKIYDKEIIKSLNNLLEKQ